MRFKIILKVCQKGRESVLERIADIMVAWDLSMDPTNSTIQHLWIWEQGGGYFGVPLTNFLGWFFTVYVVFQLFALFLHFRKAAHEETRPLPRSYYAQAIIVYGVLGLTFVLLSPLACFLPVVY